MLSGDRTGEFLVLCARWGGGALVRKNPSSGNKISNFRLITLVDVELKILVKVLAKRLALVTETLAGET